MKDVIQAEQFVSQENPSKYTILLLVTFPRLCCYVTSVVSESVRPHRRQPTRLPHPWDSPGKNTGVGCHFLPQCMKVKSESEVSQSCTTLRDPMDCSPPDSSIHRIFQAGVLEWCAIAFSLGTTEKLEQVSVLEFLKKWSYLNTRSSEGSKNFDHRNASG